MPKRLLAGQVADAAGLKSTDDVVRALKVALSGDRKKVRAMVSKARGGISEKARERVRKEVKRATKQIRSTRATTQKARRIAKAKAETRSKVRLAKPVPLPDSLSHRLRTPNGRVIRIRRGPVDRRELATLARVTDTNTRRAFASIGRNTRSLEAVASAQRKIAATQQELAKALSQMQSRGDVALLEGVMGYLAKLNFRIGRCEKKLSKSDKSLRKVLDTELSGLKQEVGTLARSTQIQKFVDASTHIQAAAFGQNGSLLDRRNLSVGATHILSSSVGDIAKWLDLGDRGPWEWISPAVSAVVGPILNTGQPRERFVSGIAEGFVDEEGFGSEGVATVDLEGVIASSLWPSFRARTDVVVTLTRVNVPDSWLLSGVVADGVLRITIVEGSSGPDPDFPTVRVAWMIDTEPVATSS